MRRENKFTSIGKTFLYLLFLALIIGGFIFIFPRFEWHAPTVEIKLDFEFIGLRPFDVVIKDKGKGLISVSIVLTNEQGEFPLIQEDYSQPVMDKNFTISLDSKKLGIKDGPATIRVTAVDGSYWGFFKGNKTILSKDVKVDITPPRVEVLSRENYINFGGSGAVIYKTPKDSVKSGVKIGDYLFKGYKGHFDNPDVYIAIFAYPYNVPTDERIVVSAEDEAGNSKEVGFTYRLKDVKYRKSTLDISDDFIESKVVPLLGDDSKQGDDLKEIFLKVNRDLRKKNEEEIKKIGENSRNEILWKGNFHQLTNSKVEANFADARTYVYNGEVIDNQYHLGYDLAVTQKYPIGAANDGVVLFAGDLGIYGNTVIIDHGLGVSTLYGHMSSIDVKVGDKIKKKQIIGRTGDTGLAAGDHLHYAVFVDGVPVLPIEWWDEKWINDNILNKIKEAELNFGTGSTQGDISEESPSQPKVQ